MLRFYYTPICTPISDFEAEKTVRDVCKLYNEKKEDVSFHTCNELVIDCLKLMVVEKVVPFEEVKIHFENEIVTINELGELSHYPHGFRDETRQILQRIFQQKRAIIQEKKDAKSH